MTKQLLVGSISKDVQKQEQLETLKQEKEIMKLRRITGEPERRGREKTLTEGTVHY